MWFEGDEPDEPEFVDIDGSWKAGREGARAGILMPADPQVGDVIRTETLYGEAEDVIEILSLTGDTNTPAADCESQCLLIRETTPLEPDTEESTFVKAGIGVILKVDEETGDREELIRFSNNAPTGASLADAKLAWYSSCTNMTSNIIRSIPTDFAE